MEINSKATFVLCDLLNNMAASTCSFRTNLALIQLSTLPSSLPVRTLGMEAEMERGRGSVPIQTSFCCLFTRLEKWEVNKQVLVFNCGSLIALPSSVLECSTPPFTVRHFDNLSFNFSPSFCLSSFGNSFGIHLFWLHLFKALLQNWKPSDVPFYRFGILQACIVFIAPPQTACILRLKLIRPSLLDFY